MGPGPCPPGAHSLETLLGRDVWGLSWGQHGLMLLPAWKRMYEFRRMEDLGARERSQGRKEEARLLGLALPLTSCVIWDKSLPLSEPWSLHCKR